jgi:adenosylmethionine-8-amino-7-oxononanoate aminotransferase
MGRVPSIASVCFNMPLAWRNMPISLTKNQISIDFHALPRKGQPSKTRLATVQRGYHGDTFGAMAVCDPVRGMHSLFQGTLAKQLFAEPPALCADAREKRGGLADMEIPKMYCL